MFVITVTKNIPTKSFPAIVARTAELYSAALATAVGQDVNVAEKNNLKE